MRGLMSYESMGCSGTRRTQRTQRTQMARVGGIARYPRMFRTLQGLNSGGLCGLQDESNTIRADSSSTAEDTARMSTDDKFARVMKAFKELVIWDELRGDARSRPALASQLQGVVKL